MRLLQAAQLRAQQIILNPPGKTAKTQSYNASRAAGQVAAYRTQLRRLGVEVDAATGKIVRDAYRAGRQLGQTELRKAGLLKPDSPISGTFSGADTRQAEILTRSAQRDMRKAINSMGDTTERLVRQGNALDLNKAKIARILAGGSVEGVPLPTLQCLRKEMRKIAKGGLVYVVNGRTGVVTTFKPDFYADLVYQTSMGQAEEAARHQQYREAGIDLVKIIGSNSRNFCTAFVGKVYSLSGTHPTYPAFSTLPRGGPPFHPRCTKRTVAFEESLATAEEIEKAQPTPDTRELENKTPAEAQKIHRENSARREAERQPSDRPERSTPTNVIEVSPSETPIDVVPTAPQPATPNVAAQPLAPRPFDVAPPAPPARPPTHEELAERFGVWRDSLDAAEELAIGRYQSEAPSTSAGYAQVNNYLRFGRPPSRSQAWIDATISGLDSAIAKGSLPEPMTVYRALRGSAELISEFRERAASSLPWVERGYSSASVLASVAPQFWSPRKIKVLFEISLPAGQRVAYPAVVTGRLPEQLELLLPRGLAVVIESVTEESDGVVRVKGRVAS